MPRGLSSPIKTELALTALSAPIYCLRVTRGPSDIFRWSERGFSFDDGGGSVAYEARVISLGGYEVSPDASAPLQITLANVDGAITTADRAKSFLGSKVEILAYLPSIATYYPSWIGLADQFSEITQESAIIPAYPSVASPNVQIPKRILGLACTHEFGNIANWVSVTDFEGSECPYQRVSTIGFYSALSGALDAVTNPVTFNAVWPSQFVTDGGFYKRGDAIKIGSEDMLITNSPAAPVGNTQSLTVTRGYRGTTIAVHADNDTILYANCGYSTADCTRRGMYGNNTADVYLTTRKRNYFGGFPFVTGFQYGTYRSKAGEKAKPLRLVFSGNESAYGRNLSLVYGRVRLNDAVLLVAKPEGDFLTTLWAIAEGVLATNTTTEDQTTPANAYINGENGLFVNGVTRHDLRPGFGIEVWNGQQDAPEPSSTLITGIADFTSNFLSFWGTARAILRINTKSNPSVDVSGANVTGAFEIAYGRLVRVYSDTVTYTRHATTNPAWVLLDVMTAKRGGGGLDYSRINIQSFIDVADYCDVSVTNTFDATSVDRWTFNGVIDQRNAYQEWMHRICSGMYCLPPYRGGDGKLKIRALKSETLSGLPIFSSKVATVARNIVWENGHSSLRKTRRMLHEIPNEIIVNFLERSGGELTRASVVISAREEQREIGIKLGDQTIRALPKSLDLPGTSTLDEAARIGTLHLRAGEFAKGGLSNNLHVEFRTSYRDGEDVELGDIIEVEDDLLNPALGEQYFRVVKTSDEPIQIDGGGFIYSRTIEAVLHANAIYDDTAATVSKFDRIDAGVANNAEPPAVTGFDIDEAGALNGNGVPISQLTINYTEPIPKDNYRSLVIWRCNDDGSGNPANDWRFIGEVMAPGETIEVENPNDWQHFAGISRAISGHVPDVETKKADLTYKYPRVRIFVDGYTDTADAEAPIVGVVKSQGQWGVDRYEMTIGVDIPTASPPVFWKSIYQTEIQVSTDATFATFPLNESLNSIYNWVPPNSIEFSTNVAGTYYVRARVYNAQGPGVWSPTLTRSTHFLDGGPDTELIAAPTPVLANVSGMEFDVEFFIPTGQSATYYGYSIYGHDSATLPTATTQETGTFGEVIAGISKLTDTSKTWTVNQWAGKDVVLFDTHRNVTPTFDYEAMFIVCEILSNTATEITFNAPPSQVRRTMSGMTYYVVNRGVNHHFWEKLTYTTAMIVDEEITTSDPSDVPGTQDRSFHMSASVPDLYIWVACYNALGQGEVTASPAHFTFVGTPSGRIDLMAITDGRAVGSIYQQRALLASNDSGFTHIRTGLLGQAQYADSTTGTFRDIAHPGYVRVTDYPDAGDAGEMIAAAVAALPATGGTVDARGLLGDWTVTSGTIQVGTEDKPILLMLSCGRIISDASVVFRVEGGSWIIGSTMGLATGGIGGSGIVATATNATAILFLAHGGGLCDLTISAVAGAVYGIMMNAAVLSTSILDNTIENIRLAGPDSDSGSKAIYMIGESASALVSFNNIKNIRTTDWHTGIVLDAAGSPAVQGPTNNWFQGIRVNGTSVGASIAGLQIVLGDVNTFIDTYFSITGTGILLDGGTKNKFYATDVEGNTLDVNITINANKTEFWGIHSENDAIVDLGQNSLIVTANDNILTKFPRPVRFGDGASAVPDSLPADAGTNLYVAGGFASPDAGRIYVGDGSGWQVSIAKRMSSVDTNLTIFKDTGAVEIVGGSAPSLMVGATGDPFILLKKYSPSLTPNSVPQSSIEEQTFTVSGLSTADTLLSCNGPTPNANCGIVNYRVSSTNTLAISFINTDDTGAQTPVAGTYIVVAMRH